MTMRPDFQLYPDELKNVGIALTRLGNQFEFTKATDTDRKIFEMAAHAEFAKFGIRVKVNWDEMIGADHVPTGIFLPGVEPCGRIKEESETDHSRVQWGIVKGLDGQAGGYIREDGTVHEEPKKKDIF